MILANAARFKLAGAVLADKANKRRILADKAGSGAMLREGEISVVNELAGRPAGRCLAGAEGPYSLPM